MKRTIVAISAVLSLAVCFALYAGAANPNGTSSASIQKPYSYQNNYICEALWDDEYIDAKDHYQIDPDMAYQIANVYFKKHDISGAYPQYINPEVSVAKVKGKAIYVVSRWEKGSLGNTTCIAIGKKDGRVLKIWAED